jgi:hypothetical protein
MDEEPLFAGNDLRLIESLVYNPDLKPSYSYMRDHLVWQDERPDGLTPEGYESLCDLFIARSFVQRGREFSSHPLDPEYFAKVWKRALAQAFRWPGFNRLRLSEQDKTYYEQMTKDAAEGRGI